MFTSTGRLMSSGLGMPCTVARSVSESNVTHSGACPDDSSAQAAVEIQQILTPSNGDHIAGTQHERGLGHLHTIDLEMTVHDTLPSLRTSARETGAAHDVVQPAFAQHQQHLARVACLARYHIEVTSQLALAQPVVVLDLLLLTQRHTIVRRSSRTRVHTRRIIAPLHGSNGTSVFVNQCTQTTIDTCLGTGVTCHAVDISYADFAISVPQTTRSGIAHVRPNFGTLAGPRHLIFVAGKPTIMAKTWLLFKGVVHRFPCFATQKAFQCGRYGAPTTTLVENLRRSGHMVGGVAVSRPNR